MKVFKGIVNGKKYSTKEDYLNAITEAAWTGTIKASYTEEEIDPEELIEDGEKAPSCKCANQSFLTLENVKEMIDQMGSENAKERISQIISEQLGTICSVDEKTLEDEKRTLQSLTALIDENVNALVRLYKEANDKRCDIAEKLRELNVECEKYTSLVSHEYDVQQIYDKMKEFYNKLSKRAKNVELKPDICCKPKKEEVEEDEDEDSDSELHNTLKAFFDIFKAISPGYSSK